MLWTLVLFYLVRLVSADDVIVPTCSDNPETRMTFTPVEGYVGRYIAELCTASKGVFYNSTIGEWETHVQYFKSRDYCRTPNSAVGLHARLTHSSNYEYISRNHSCTDDQLICMSATFDMIFSACYLITSRFNKTTRFQDFYFNVTNPYSAEFMSNNVARVYPQYHSNDMTITWQTGVPVLAYKVEFCNIEELDECEPVTNCRIVDKAAIECTLDPEYGCYVIYLRHEAPWIKSIFSKQEIVSYDFCRNETKPGAAPPSARAAPWAWGAAAALALAAGACAARAACRSLAASKRKKEILRSWLVSRREEDPRVEVARPPCKHVLLLYARECTAASRAVAALRLALQGVVEGQVYDIFSPEVMSLCASAPYEWIKTTLQSSDVAVVLLQTPALHCLYSTHAVDTDSGLTLVPPLLGRRVAPRAPQFGDSLLQYALRLTAESARARDDYRKYYIATVAGLEGAAGAEAAALRGVVPFRRYRLPGAARALLAHVAPSRSLPPEAARALDALSLLLAEYVDYAKENPDYLMEQLVLVDSP